MLIYCFLGHIESLFMYIIFFLSFISVAILFGLWNVLSIIGLSVSCLVAGIIQMVAGFVVMALEAPFCFVCIEKVNDVSKMVDAKPMFFRAGLYCA